MTISDGRLIQLINIAATHHDRDNDIFYLAFARLVEKELAAKNENSAKAHLQDLVTALEHTYWSSWQTTARFNNELEDAQRFLKENP